MSELTTYERMKRVYEHRDPDRAPIIDDPWASTIARWRREGLPADVSFADYFGLDKYASIGADNSPRYPEVVLEETEEYTISTTRWGSTQRVWKHVGGVPEWLDFKVKTPDDWLKAKARMEPTPDRVDWARLKANYPIWRREGRWIQASFWFGFDVTHSRFIGTERMLIAMIEQPDWASDMFNHWLDVDLALFDMVWEAGYHFDVIRWPDDMGYKAHQFFSPKLYRELVKPVHKRAADWAHARGAKVELHSCGNIMPFVPDLVGAGIDMLNPLEVKAGMDPAKLKGEFGDMLAFHGGLNAALYTEPELLWEEMRRLIPILKRNGGYVISSDHSVPESVSLETFGQWVALAKELGAY